MRVFIFLIAIIFSTSLGYSSELEDAARTYVKSPVQQKMIDDMFSSETVINQMKALNPNISEDELPVIGKIVSEELLSIRASMEEAMIKGSMETFTLDELKALIAFYNSGPGASVMLKMQPFMTSVMNSIGPDMRQMQQNIMRRAQSELK